MYYALSRSLGRKRITYSKVHNLNSDMTSSSYVTTEYSLWAVMVPATLERKIRQLKVYQEEMFGNLVISAEELGKVVISTDDFVRIPGYRGKFYIQEVEYTSEDIILILRKPVPEASPETIHI